MAGILWAIILRVDVLRRAIDLRVAGAGLVCWDDLEGSEGQAGGTCGNVLANLAYLGAKARLFDRLDFSTEAGRLIRADLEGMGVDLRWAAMFPSDSAPWLHRWLTKREGGYRWESKPVALEEIQITGLEGKLPAARVFFFDRANAATLGLARHYKERGSTIFFEPQGSEDASGDREAALEMADIVQTSAAYFPSSAWVAPHAQLEIRTEGKKGLRWRLGGDEGRMRALKAQVVDSAGSGDWLSAGLIAALHAGEWVGLEQPRALEAALRQGAALAALNCEFAGARGMVYELSRDELAARLGERQASRARTAAA